MNSKSIVNTVVLTLKRTSAFLGFIPSVCIVLFMIITAGSLISTRSIEHKKLTAFVGDTHDHLQLTESINSKAISIKLAILSEDWDELAPIHAELARERAQWASNHDSLRVNALHHQSIRAPVPTQQDEIETITELFDRIEYQRRKIDDASSELISLTQSVIRRAPYIDALTMSRIDNASSTITNNTPDFDSIMNLINRAVSEHAAQESAAGVAKVRFWNLLSLAAFTLTIIIGFAPKIWNAECDIRQLHDDLDQSNEEHSNHWRDITSISQSLSAPLQEIGAVAQKTSSADQPDPDSIASTASALLTMTQDLETLSKSFTGSIKLDPIPINPAEFFSTLIDQYRPIITEQDLKFIPQLDDQLPSSITTDPTELNRVVSKVLDNAIQHTTQGRIELHINYEPSTTQDATGDQICIRVVDSGPGISPKALTTIFEPFNRESQSSAPARTGIGLPLARRLSRELGGDLTIESAQGAGTYVTITIAATIATDYPNETVTSQEKVPGGSPSDRTSDMDDAKHVA
ncbi:MAG: sensor histidine kinase [Phycisphaerales bacterium]